MTRQPISTCKTRIFRAALIVRAFGAVDNIPKSREAFNVE
jgi:hypothetical protein